MKLNISARVFLIAICIELVLGGLIGIGFAIIYILTR